MFIILSVDKEIIFKGVFIMKKKGMFSTVCGDWFKPVGADIFTKEPYRTNRSKIADIILIVVEMLLLLCSVLSLKYGDYIAYTPARETEWIYTGIAVLFMFLMVVVYFARSTQQTIAKTRYEEMESTRSELVEDKEQG